MELEDLKCPICLEVLGDPVMLPACGHSLCRACLMAIKPQPPSCPICRKPHQGPPPEKLPTNYSVANLARTHHVNNPEVAIDEEEMTTQQAPCAPLSHSPTTPTSPLPSAPTSTLPMPSSSAPTTAPSSAPFSAPTPITALAPSLELLDASSTVPSSNSQIATQTSVSTAPDTVSQTGLTIAPTRTSPSAPPLSEFTESDMELIFAGLQPPMPRESSMDRPSSTDQLVPSQDGVSNHRISLIGPPQRSTSEYPSASDHHTIDDLPHDLPLNHHTTDDHHASLVVSLDKPHNPPLFSCKQCVSGMVLSVAAFLFFSSYCWMIILGVTRDDFHSHFEPKYLLVGGAVGVPKFIHLALRFVKGNTTQFEEYLFFLYFVFDIVLLGVGAVEVYIGTATVKVLLLVNHPFMAVVIFSMFISALSITKYPVTPRLKAKSCCAKFTGSTMFLVLTLTFLASYIYMLIYGSKDFKSWQYDQIYLIFGGVAGIVIILHCAWYLLKGKFSCCQVILGIVYIVYHCAWLIVGLLAIKWHEFIIVNTPMLLMVFMSLLVWCLRVTTRELMPPSYTHRSC